MDNFGKPYQVQVKKGTFEIDFLLEDKVAIEIQGPHHFVKTLDDSSGESIAL